MDPTRLRRTLLLMRSGLALAFMISIAPRDLSATVYACAIDYPEEVEERYWAAISRYNLYPSGDDLCTHTEIGWSDLGQFKHIDPKALALRLMADFGGLWRATGKETLHLIINVGHPNGSSHWRFQERIDGRPVLNGGVIVETETASGRITSIWARFLPDFRLTQDPAIAASEAIKQILATRKARERSLPPLHLIPDPRLSWYLMTNEARLVWEVEVPEISAQDAPVRNMYLVDAQNGRILAGSNTCDGTGCRPDSGVHQISWSPSADAEFYELSCSRDAEFITSVETVYVGKLTDVVAPMVTDTWCRVRACNLAGCSVWVGSVHAAAWPDCGTVDPAQLE